MVNINDKVRNIVINIIEDGYLNGLDAYDTAQITTESLYNLYRNSFSHQYNFESVANYVYFWMFTEICYLDAIKYYNYLEKNLLLNENDKVNYYILKDIKDDMDLMAQVSYNPDTFTEMITKTYEYAKSSDIKKSIMVKSLEDEENKRLLKICPDHMIDLELLGKDNPIKLDDLIEEYINTDNYNKNTLNITDKDLAINDFVNYIRKIYYIDIDSFFDIVNELYDLDYCITSYLKENTNNDRSIDEHYNLYESLDDEEIYGLMITNNNFLKQSINNIINLYINHNYKNIKLDIDSILRIKR